MPLLLPVDVTVDEKCQRLVDKGGNLLNENSSFESRLGGNIFFFFPSKTIKKKKKALLIR